MSGGGGDVKFGLEASANFNNATNEAVKSLDKIKKAQDETSASSERARKQVEKNTKETNTNTQAEEKNTKAKKDKKASIDSVTQSMGQEAKTMALQYIGLTALIAVLGNVVKGYADYEKSIMNTVILLNGSRADFEEFYDSLQSVSLATGKSALELSDALYEVVSSGIKASDSIEFLTVAAKLGRAGMADTKDVVKGLTAVINAYGLSASDATSVADKFFVAQDRGQLVIRDLATQIGDVAGIAVQAGVSLNALLASISTITLAGVPAAEAVTEVKQIIAGIIDPSKEAAEAAAALGINFSTATVRAKGLPAVLAEVIEKTQGSELMISKLFPSVRALNGIFILGGQGAKRYAEDINALEGSMNRLETGHQQSLTTLSAQWDIFIANLKNKATDFGKIVGKFATPVLTALNDTPANDLNDLNERIKRKNDELFAANKRLEARQKTIDTFVDPNKKSKAIIPGGSLRGKGIEILKNITGGVKETAEASAAMVTLGTAKDEVKDLENALVSLKKERDTFYAKNPALKPKKKEKDLTGAAPSKPADPFKAQSDAIREMARAKDISKGVYSDSLETFELEFALQEKSLQTEENYVAKKIQLNEELLANTSIIGAQRVAVIKDQRELEKKEQESNLKEYISAEEQKLKIQQLAQQQSLDFSLDYFLNSEYLEMRHYEKMLASGELYGKEKQKAEDELEKAREKTHKKVADTLYNAMTSSYDDQLGLFQNFIGIYKGMMKGMLVDYIRGIEAQIASQVAGAIVTAVTTKNPMHAANAVAVGAAQTAVLEGLVSSVQGLETGGVVMGEGIYRMGEKNKKEAVVPLESGRGQRALTKALENALAKGSMGGGQSVTVPVYLDGRQIAEVVTEHQAKDAALGKRFRR